jgi:hypothetical protein
MRSTIIVFSAFLVRPFPSGTAASLKIGAKALRSSEDFIRNSSRKFASGKESPFRPEGIAKMPDIKQLIICSSWNVDSVSAGFAKDHDVWLFSIPLCVFTAPT